MSAARPTLWWPTTPGRNSNSTDRCSLNPASLAKRSSALSNSCDNSGVTIPLHGGDEIRYAFPEGIGISGPHELTLSPHHIAVGGVVPVASHQPSANFLHSLGSSRNGKS